MNIGRRRRGMGEEEYWEDKRKGRRGRIG